ncbi:MAG TPA: type I glyceraldehyde-3-phosphate dehydrogenase [Candidatus Gracilibacteria bacterium]
MKKIAINGFGRIGRCVARIILSEYADQLDLVAINDPSPSDQTTLLFEYDSNYGKYPGTVTNDADGTILNVNGKKIKKYSTREISELPWGDLGVDIVLECTGVFRTAEKCQPHLDQGAGKVLLSAPAKCDNFKMIVLGVNEQELTGEEKFISNASCTTNGLAPMAKALHEAFGIESGLMTTIHSYTNDQNILDVGHKDIRRARAAALNLIPTSTGAAKAVGKVLPALNGKLNGLSIRIPTPTVSLVDLVVKLKKPATAEEVNKALKAASKKMPHILGYEEKPLVSMDYKGDSRSSIIDAAETMVIGDQVKVLAWYDNEWGYSSRMAELAVKL